MEVEIYNYKISPYSGNTCWKIQEKQTKEGTKGVWKEPNYYPSTFEQALLQVAELVGRNSKKNAANVKEALQEYRQILRGFEQVAEDISNCKESD